MLVVLYQNFNLETDMFIMAISIFVLAMIFVFLISITFVVVFKNKLPRNSFIKIVNSIFRILIIVVIILLVIVRYTILKR